MKIESLKQLESVLKLCRKQGVTDIKIDGIELHLGPVQTKPVSYKYSNLPDVPVITPYTPGGVTEATPVAEAVQISTDELSEEELMFYSSRPETGTEAGAQ